MLMYPASRPKNGAPRHVKLDVSRFKVAPGVRPDSGGVGSKLTPARRAGIQGVGRRTTVDFTGPCTEAAAVN